VLQETIAKILDLDEKGEDDKSKLEKLKIKN